jgi:hypothetical protein
MANAMVFVALYSMYLAAALFDSLWYLVTHLL